MTALAPEVEMDLDALVSAELPPCQFIDVTFVGERRCNRPSDAVVTLRCPEGTSREAQCDPHVTAALRGDYLLRCETCDGVMTIVEVSR